MKTLLIDDDSFALKMMTHQLASLGYTDITSHERGHEALAILKSQHSEFKLVICDLQMPDMDGIEFVRHLAGIGYAGGLI